MITFENNAFKQEVENHPLSKRKLATFADSTDNTLKKILDREVAGMNVASIDKMASYLDFDVKISLVKRAPSAALAG